eukprot:Sspe_Gene.56303::Locus_30986_Transcript_1_1_Confidence_1.000_Length_817::g.56303::m.56303
MEHEGRLEDPPMKDELESVESSIEVLKEHLRSTTRMLHHQQHQQQQQLLQLQQQQQQERELTPHRSSSDSLDFEKVLSSAGLTDEERQVVRDAGIASTADLLRATVPKLTRHGLPPPCARRLLSIAASQPSTPPPPSPSPRSALVNVVPVDDTSMAVAIHDAEQASATAVKALSAIQRGMAHLSTENTALRQAIALLKDEMFKNQVAFEEDRLAWREKVSQLQHQISEMERETRYYPRSPRR